MKMIHGVGFGTHSGAMFFDVAAFNSLSDVPGGRPVQQTVPDAGFNTGLPWSPWGADNLLVRKYLADIGKTGILEGIIEGKGRFAVCQGLVPVITKINEQGQKVIERIVTDNEIVRFLDINNHFFQCYEWMRDLVGLSWSVVRFKLNTKGDKIVRFRRDDPSECRLSKKDKKTRRSMELWFSADWDKVKSPNDERVFSVQLLDPDDPVTDMQEKAAKNIFDHAYIFGKKGWGTHYYPVPSWMSVEKWIKIVQGIPEMKAALFQNAMRLRMQVIIQEEFWQEKFGELWPDEFDEQNKLKQQVFDEIDKWLVGPQNAHKTIFTTGYKEEGKVYSNIEFRPIDDNTKPGELLPDSAAGNSEIAFTMLWNNAMTGGNQASGLYESSQGGSNVRESILMQVIIHEVERQHITHLMNIVKYFNGWDVKFPGLEFIIPATILTTTDTGGGSKPINTGDAKSKKDADQNT
jgi:hypothetical protein